MIHNDQELQATQERIAYFQRLLARGLKRRVALMAVMRKMLAVAYHLLKTHEPFDPSKVGLTGAA